MNLEDPFNPLLKEEPPKPTSFDYATKFIIPILSLAAVIVSALQQHPVAMGVLIGITLLSLVLSFAPQATAAAKRFVKTRRVERTAKHEFPYLLKFIDRFGEFVSTSSGITLHAIARSEAHSSDPGPLMKLGMPSIDIFQSFWLALNKRAETEDITTVNFQLTLSEFGKLISLFISHCMCAVFERLPQELRIQPSGPPKQVEDQIDWQRMGRTPPGQLSEDVKRSLEGFRERFHAFLNDYEGFLRSFDEGFSQGYAAGCSFRRVKPL